jgi:hypothetical protein
LFASQFFGVARVPRFIPFYLVFCFGSASLGWGKHPTVNTIITALLFIRLISMAMKINQRKNKLTFGDLVTTVYNACGKRKARGMLWLAVNAQLVEFRGRNRYVIF